MATTQAMTSLNYTECHRPTLAAKAEASTGSAQGSLHLLVSILPIFQARAESDCSEIDSESDLFAIYTDLRSQLEVLRSLAIKLQVHFHKHPGDSNTYQTRLKHTLSNLMDFLEQMFILPGADTTYEPRFYKYPSLSKVCQEQTIPDDFTFFTDIAHQDVILGFLDSIIPRLQGLLDRSSSHIDRQPDQSQRSPLIIRDSIQSLRTAMKECWTCECSEPHHCMIFLATQRSLLASQPLLTFNMLFRAQQNSTPGTWRESQIFVTPSPTSEDKGELGQFMQPKTMPNKGPISCAELNSATMSHGSLNLCLDNLKLYRTTPSPSRLISRNISTSETIRSIIRQTNIKTEVRIILGILLSYSILYMSGSTWLPPAWNSSLFHILKSKDGAAVFLRPLLSAVAPCEPIKNLEHTEGEINKHADIIQLGVALLELFLHESIDHFRDDKKDLTYTSDGAISIVDTDFYTAARVHDTMFIWETYKNWQSAVEACLNPNFPIPENGEQMNAQHCSYIIDRIIGPLEKELEAVSQITPDKIDEIIMKSTSILYSRRDQLTYAHAGNQAPHTEHSPSNANDKDVDNLYRIESSAKVQSFDAWSSRERGESSATSNSVTKGNLGQFEFDFIDHFDEYSLRVTEQAQICQLANQWLRLFDRTIYSEALRETWATRIPPENVVKIAILDSGISSLDSIMQKNTQRWNYRDFVRGEHSDPKDLIGHGTHTTSILLNVAQNAHVFVARVFESRKVKVDLCHIVEAISYATDVWKVDIICMPFGIPRQTIGLQGIRDAISHAYSKGIVMFAAAANYGGLDRTTFPANHSDVICVSSTDGAGNRSRFNPSPENEHEISVLGEAVPANWFHSHVDRKSGTSFATPIAAGLGGILIDYVERRKREWSEAERDIACRVKHKSGVIALMRRNMSTPRGGVPFLTPWCLFQDRSLETIDALLINALRDV